MVLFMIKPVYSKLIAIRHQITVCMLFYMLEITSHLLEIFIVDLMINISLVMSFLQENSAMSLQAIIYHI